MTLVKSRERYLKSRRSRQRTNRILVVLLIILSGIVFYLLMDRAPASEPPREDNYPSLHAQKQLEHLDPRTLPRRIQGEISGQPEQAFQEIVLVDVVEIPSDIAILGRTEEEIDYSVRLCRSSANVNEINADYVCREEYFADVPYRTKLMNAFWIDRYEFHSDVSKLPLLVSFEKALEICSIFNGRLPTADEWEFAARGPEGRLWPWGSRWDENSGPIVSHANVLVIDPPVGIHEVGQYPLGATPNGIHDMMGNVAEWVVVPRPTEVLPAKKGGGYNTFASFAEPSHILFGKKNVAGVRCVYDDLSFDK